MALGNSHGEKANLSPVFSAIYLLVRTVFKEHRYDKLHDKVCQVFISFSLDGIECLLNHHHNTIDSKKVSEKLKLLSVSCL